MMILLLSEIMNIGCSQVCIKLRPRLKSPIIIKKPPKHESNKLERTEVPAQPVIPEPVKSLPAEDNELKVDWAYSPVDLVFLAKQEEGLHSDLMQYKRSLERKLWTVNR